jgi:hypothetical protein
MFLLLLLQVSCLNSRLVNYTFQLDAVHGDIITDHNKHAPHRITHVECGETMGNRSQCSTQLSLGFSITNAKMVCNDMLCNLTFTTEPNDFILFYFIYNAFRLLLDISIIFLRIICFFPLSLTGTILLSHTFEVYVEEAVTHVDDLNSPVTSFMIGFWFAFFCITSGFLLLSVLLHYYREQKFRNFF